MDRAELEKEIERRKWFHTIEVAPGLWTKGHYNPDSNWVFGAMGLPRDMKRMRTLDLGCADGPHACAMARRGAQATAVDVFTPDFRNVEFLSQLWDIPVEYVQSTVYEFKREPFDIVLALGVLYHLQYPLLGLHRLNALCKDVLILETAVMRGWSMSCRFFPGKELSKAPDNWWAPTKKCLLAMMKSSGFEIEKTVRNAPGRLLVRAKKVKNVEPAFNCDDVFKANFGVPAP